MATSPRGARPPGRPGRSGRGRPHPPSDAPSGVRPADVITALVAEPLAAAGFDVEDVAVRRSGAQHVVSVAVDRDGGLDLDAVADASRLVSEVLDARDADLPVALRGAYVLEVSSRGATEPLVLPRHWRRAAGRLVEVHRTGRSPVVGRIAGADDDGADLDVDGAAERVAFADVTRAVVQLEFRAPAGFDEPPGNGDEGDDDLDDLDDLDDPGDLDDPDAGAADDEEETP